jgi:predicted nuclease with TOPRIM domain
LAVSWAYNIWGEVMAKKWSVQDELVDLRTKLAQTTHELREARMRTATLAEEKQKVDEQVAYLTKKYDMLYDDLLVQILDNKELRVAAEFYRKEAVKVLKEIGYRGSKRESHDPEYAVVRALIRSHNELSAENLRKMSERYPKVNLRKLICVAAEFSSGEEGAVKPVDVRVWWTGDAWKT